MSDTPTNTPRPLADRMEEAAEGGDILSERYRLLRDGAAEIRRLQAVCKDAANNLITEFATGRYKREDVCFLAQHALRMQRTLWDASKGKNPSPPPPRRDDKGA